MGYPDMMRDILMQAKRANTADKRRALELQPIIDPATGLYSRAYFDLRLDEEMARSRLYGNKLTLMIIDTDLSMREDDRGKQGLSGERAMRILSGILLDCLKDAVDLAFVFDTGKFAVILPETTMHEAVMTADHILETILREKLPGVIPRAGIVQYGEQEDIGELIEAADEALHGNGGIK